MMLIHPLDVPARMWLPSAVKMVTHVECFASWAACFAATVGSISSGFDSCERRGAEGRMRFMGLGEYISTRTGWSSNSDATKSQLVDKSARVSTKWLFEISGGPKNQASEKDALVKRMQFCNIYWGFESYSPHA